MDQTNQNAFRISSTYKEPMAFDKATMDVLFRRKDPTDSAILFMFYYYTAKWQNTTTVKATTSYVCQAFSWGKQRVLKAKHILEGLNLIRNVVCRDKQNKVMGHFIELYPSQEKSQTPYFPPSGFQGANKDKIREDKIRSGIVNRDTKQKQSFIQTFPPIYQNDPAFVKAWQEWENFRNVQIKKPLTKSSVERQVTLLTQTSPTEAVAIIEQSLAHDWRGLFPLQGQTGGRVASPTKPVTGMAADPELAKLFVTASQWFEKRTGRPLLRESLVVGFIDYHAALFGTGQTQTTDPSFIEGRPNHSMRYDARWVYPSPLSLLKEYLKELDTIPAMYIQPNMVDVAHWRFKKWIGTMQIRKGFDFMTGRPIL
jgi:hypothetical protein